MPIINRVAAMQDEIAAWRRDMHEHPEILYDVHRTAGIVADKLKAFGCDEVVPGIGRTGVVGVIKGRKAASGKVIGCAPTWMRCRSRRAPACPMPPRRRASMHACGHDGHTAMLLGAAKYLCETRNFDGTAVVIFQPAEEGGAGGKAMVDDGMMDRWSIQEVYGMHNMPGIPVGQFAIRPGPLLAASDRIHIEITGKGGHAARPHQCIDPVLVGSPHRARRCSRSSRATSTRCKSAVDLDLHVPCRRGRSTSSRRRPSCTAPRARSTPRCAT